MQKDLIIFFIGKFGPALRFMKIHNVTMCDIPFKRTHMFSRRKYKKIVW